MKIERPAYMQQLIESKDNGLIKIVTGLRRVGKSYLLKTLFKEYLLKEGVGKDHILIVDLEDRKQKAFKDPDYLLDWVDEQMADDGQYYVIIDEVQKVEEFVDMLGPWQSRIMLTYMSLAPIHISCQVTLPRSFVAVATRFMSGRLRSRNI